MNGSPYRPRGRRRPFTVSTATTSTNSTVSMEFTTGYTSNTSRVQIAEERGEETRIRDVLTRNLTRRGHAIVVFGRLIAEERRIPDGVAFEQAEEELAAESEETCEAVASLGSSWSGSSIDLLAAARVL